MSKRSADARLVVGRLRGPDQKDFAFAAELVDLAGSAGVDPVLALIQWLLETGNASSPRWNNDLNSSGIGIVANDTEQPFVIPDVRKSAALHVQCLYSLVNRKLHPDIPLWPQADTWMERIWLPKVRSNAMPDVRTVGDLGLRYVENGRPRATWSFEDGVAPQDTYGKKLANRGREFYPEAADQELVQGGEGPSSTVPAEVEEGPIVFGRVPRPPMVEMIVDKPVHQGSGFGYDRAPAPRKNVGLVHHETQGRGSGQFYHDFFSCPDGERCKNALVDFFIDKQGTIFMFNDPFGTRAGWANGGGVSEAGGLEGDGVRFFSIFGANGINFKLVSIEYEKLNIEDFTDKQVQSGGALAAWIHDLDGQPWEQHPFVPKYGCVTSFLHYEFGTTDCGKGELDDISRVQAVTKGIMRRFQQGGGSSAPIEPDVVELPAAPLPGGLSLAEAQERFGTYRKHLPNGRVVTGGFDPEGIISLAWANRAAEEGEWPRIADWYVFEDSAVLLNLVTFENGWMMVQKSERSGLMWVNLVPVDEEEDATRGMDGAFSRRVLGNMGEIRESVGELAKP
ncbi:MAG: N-acetylmuramoyl-L-alanine amidase [Thermomicrobiales bacterium]|nr:N-acetylmuramoyl-L-alanine amidase [Thermomicrobiales bacterium]